MQFFINLVLTINMIIAVNTDANLSIYIDEIKESVVYNSLNQEIMIELADTATALYHITDTKGAGSLTVKDLKTDVNIVQGNYVNALDTFKAYLFTFNEDEGRELVSVVSYFHPLKNGEWKYWNNEGLLIRTEIYNDGVLVVCKGCKY